MMSKLTNIMASAAIALMPVNPLMADTASLQSDPVAEAWEPATQLELDEARGGYFWVVGAGGTAIRLCLSNSKACQATGVFVAKNLVSAKSWACKKYGRFC